MRGAPYERATPNEGADASGPPADEETGLEGVESNAQPEAFFCPPLK